jgi:hypothetical protein
MQYGPRNSANPLLPKIAFLVTGQPKVLQDLHPERRLRHIAALAAVLQFIVA